MKVIVHNWDWWAYFWRVIHRQRLKGIEKWDSELVKFVVKIPPIKFTHSLKASSVVIISKNK